MVRILEAGKPGPWTGKVLSNVLEWQLECPRGTKDECEQWLRREKATGRILVDVAPQSRAAPAKKERKDGRGGGMKRTKTDI